MVFVPPGVGVSLVPMPTGASSTTAPAFVTNMWCAPTCTVILNSWLNTVTSDERMKPELPLGRTGR